MVAIRMSCSNQPYVELLAIDNCSVGKLSPHKGKQ